MIDKQEEVTDFGIVARALHKILSSNLNRSFEKNGNHITMKVYDVAHLIVITIRVEGEIFDKVFAKYFKT